MIVENERKKKGLLNLKQNSMKEKENLINSVATFLSNKRGVHNIAKDANYREGKGHSMKEVCGG